MDASVIPVNIVSGFSKTGIYPTNRDAVPDDVLKVSNVHKTCTDEQAGGKDVTTFPSVEENSVNIQEKNSSLPLPKSIQSWRKRKHPASSPRVFQDTVRPSTSQEASGVQQVLCRTPSTLKRRMPVLKESTANFSNTPQEKRDSQGPVKETHFSTMKRRAAVRRSNVNRTEINDNVCSSCGGDYEDDKSGQNWIQCLKCECWFHEACQGLNSYYAEFICRLCTEDDSD